MNSSDLQLYSGYKGDLLVEAKYPRVAVNKPNPPPRLIVDVYKKSDGPICIAPIGDAHIGALSESGGRLDTLEWAMKNSVDNGCYIVLMGDLMETALKNSVGWAVYEQWMNPHEQFMSVLDLIGRYKDRVIGYLSSNHEMRILKSVGIDLQHIISELHGIPYADSLYFRFKLSDEGVSVKRKVFALHGTGYASYPHTRINKPLTLTRFVDADIILYAHTHSRNYLEYVRISDGEDVVSYVVNTGALVGSMRYSALKGFPTSILGYYHIHMGSRGVRFEEVNLPESV